MYILCWIDVIKFMELFIFVFFLVFILIFFLFVWILFIFFIIWFFCVFFELLYDVNKGVKVYDCLNVKKI